MISRCSRGNLAKRAWPRVQRTLPATVRTSCDSSSRVNAATGCAGSSAPVFGKCARSNARAGGARSVHQRQERFLQHVSASLWLSPSARPYNNNSTLSPGKAPHTSRLVVDDSQFSRLLDRHQTLRDLYRIRLKNQRRCGGSGDWIGFRGGGARGPAARLVRRSGQCHRVLVEPGGRE